MPHRSKIHDQENRAERKAKALRERRARYEHARGGTARQRGYNAQWERDRTAYLVAHPLCVECLRQGRVTPATVLDHVTPHRGDRVLFLDPYNRQGLCVPCHGAKTVRESITTTTPLSNLQS